MIDLRLEYAATLMVISEEGTFDAAAARLRITPSAVSQRIKSMEQSLGQVLLQRTTPIRLTTAGDVVLRFARQVELLTGDASRALQLDGAGSAGGPRTIAIAVNADSLATWFLDALVAVPRELGLVFDLQRDDEQHTSDLLRSGAVLAAVTARPQTVQGCTSDPLGGLTYRAVASSEFVERELGIWNVAHPDLAAFGRAPVVDFDHKDGLQSRFLREIGVRGARPARHFVPTSSDYARAVRLGLGWGMLPPQQSAAELSSGELVDLFPEHPLTVPLFWQRWNLSSPALDAVTEAVVAAARRGLGGAD